MKAGRIIVVVALLLIVAVAVWLRWKDGEPRLRALQTVFGLDRTPPTSNPADLHKLIGTPPWLGLEPVSSHAIASPSSSGIAPRVELAGGGTIVAVGAWPFHQRSDNGVPGVTPEPTPGALPAFGQETTALMPSEAARDAWLATGDHGAVESSTTPEPAAGAPQGHLPGTTQNPSLPTNAVFGPSYWTTSFLIIGGAPVHGWIALQAYKQLPSGPLKTEMQQYLPTDDSSPYYADDFPAWPAIPWTLVDTVICKPTAWGGCGVGPAATALIEGAFEEDEPACYGGPDSNHSHYWNPDGGYMAGYGIANSALFDAQDHFAAALASYPTDKAAAYYQLGRAAHLLADMSVPAHTLLDEHGGTTGQFDSFEDYTATGSNYKAITFLQSVTDALLDPPSAYLSQGDTNLTRLFYTLAKKSKGFDSDDANGVSIEFGSGKYNHGAGTISDSDLQTVYQPNLEARAVGYTAALYQRFWNTTHLPPVIQPAGPSFGVGSNQFGFNITQASGRTLVVEAATNLVNPIWSPLQTNTLNGDSFYFSDPRWTNYAGRFYRIRSP